jgi:hypothetical protein
MCYCRRGRPAQVGLKRASKGQCEDVPGLCDLVLRDLGSLSRSGSNITTWGRDLRRSSPSHQRRESSEPRATPWVASTRCDLSLKGSQARSPTGCIWLFPGLLPRALPWAQRFHTFGVKTIVPRGRARRRDSATPIRATEGQCEDVPGLRVRRASTGLRDPFACSIVSWARSADCSLVTLSTYRYVQLIS